jgi:hypothetical protein
MSRAFAAKISSVLSPSAAAIPSSAAFFVAVSTRASAFAARLAAAQISPTVVVTVAIF